MYALVIKQGFVKSQKQEDQYNHLLGSQKLREYNQQVDKHPFSLAARVTPTLPKQDRPVREGTRVASIETGLAAAAAKLAQQVSVDTQPVALLLMI